MLDLEDMVEARVVVDPLEAAREAWLKERRGRITCSRFGDLIGTGKAKEDEFTQVGYSYLRGLVAERLGSWHSVSAKSMEWGTEHEAEAIAAYSKRMLVEVDSAPFNYFAYTDDIGGTPDGLIGNHGCLEIKCPFDPAVHVKTLLTREVPKEYEWQVVGHMLVTNCKWCDFVSYDPRMQMPQGLVVVRVERDEARIAFLKSRLQKAVDVLKGMMDVACG